MNFIYTLTLEILLAYLRFRFSVKHIPMKNCFVLLLITLSIGLSKAQNNDYRFVASAHSGYTYLSIYNNVTGMDLNIEKV